MGFQPAGQRYLPSQKPNVLLTELSETAEDICGAWLKRVYYIGSYMSDHVLLNLLNELGEKR